MAQTFAQVAGFVLLLVLLTLANRTKLGHVIIYYSLLMMIIIILLTEAPQYAAIMGNLQFTPKPGTIPNTSGG